MSHDGRDEARARRAGRRRGSTRAGGRRRRAAATARLCVCAAVLAAGVAQAAGAQSWRTITSARQLHGERELDVAVQYAAGRFRLAPGGEEGQLYRLEMRYDEEKFAPLRDYDAAAGTLRLGMRTRHGANVSLRDRRRSPPPYLDLSLTPEIPLSLSLDLGAVESDVELGGLALRRVTYRTGASETRLRFTRANPVECEQLRLEAGAASFEASGLANSNCARISFHGGVGEVTLDFTGSWRRSMEADLDVGIGSLNLRLPREVGVAVRLNRFLASFDASGLEKRGDTYYTANWGTARQRLTLHVNAAIGSIGLSWAQP